ncbi:MAG: hypothetical protein VXX04_05245, partial [Actinomycetota bacterium]|nr:hypothetical protein [Actinomycetota bacterium]
MRTNAAGDTGCVVVAVIVLSTSRANLRADVRIAAGGRRITVIVKLALIGTHHRLRGAFGAVLADDAVLARSGAVGVPIRFSHGTLNARWNIDDRLRATINHIQY